MRGLTLRVVIGLVAVVLGLAIVQGIRIPAVRQMIQSAAGPTQTLAEARKNFRTQISLSSKDPGPAPTPPKGLFAKIAYPSAVGPLPAYLTPDPGDRQKHPAIVWITGGDTNSIGDVWTPQRPENEQSASAFRKAGIVMLFPSLRGGNDNPGAEEGFYGEVDDVLAAADFLAQQPYVDPARIYLGGHSTGGTLALLTAETSGRFRAVFCFGPADRGTSHPTFFKDLDMARYDHKEVTLRAPGIWLASIRSPVFIIEGRNSPSNIDSLDYMMQKANGNPLIHFIPVIGATHFTVLGPGNDQVARAILEDTGPTAQIDLSLADLASAR